MDEKAVMRYVEHAQSTIQDSPQMGEATTKAAVLRDFLDLLGWEIPANTELEYSVKAFGRTFKVDYALVLEGVPVAFLEAKGVDTSLTDDHREQIQEYMKTEGVNLGILTNGKQYSFFRRQVIDSTVNVNALAETNFQNLPKRITILRAFTKEAIQNDEWIKILNRISELKQARDILKNKKENLAAQITELFTETVSDAISSPAESQSKEMIDRLIVDIEQEIDLDNSSTTQIKEVSNKRQRTLEDVSSENTGEHPFDTSGRYIIKISTSNDVTAAVSGQTQSKAMIEVANYFIRYHNLIDRINVPWVPSQTKAIINDKPDWKKADPVYKELIGGYYIDTKLNKNGKKREIKRMAGKCGLGVTFEGDW